MKITATLTHAFAATAYIAENYKDGLVLSARISKEYDIPLEYLLVILKYLVKAQLLRSKTGPKGGFTLACDPKDISMLQIIEAVNGSLMMDMSMAEMTDNAGFALKMEGICTKAIEKEKEVFDKAKLSDMLK
jgi:Rrf2 family protein